MEDIIEYSNNVTMLIKGYTLEGLIADKRTYYSVRNTVESSSGYASCVGA